MKQIEQYEHHGVMVSTDKYLRGLHRSHCLCFFCDKFIPEDREKNCPVANQLFALCVEYNLTTPVYECPIFVPHTVSIDIGGEVRKVLIRHDEDVNRLARGVETDEQQDRRREILLDILAERERQLTSCGWDTEFDDKNTPNDWVAFITRYASEGAYDGRKSAYDPSRFVEFLTKAATLCVAAVESFYRRGGNFPPRHYDQKK